MHDYRYLRFFFNKDKKEEIPILLPKTIQYRIKKMFFFYMSGLRISSSLQSPLINNKNALGDFG